LKAIFEQIVTAWIGGNCLGCGLSCGSDEFCGICEKGIEWDVERLKSGYSVYKYADIIRKVIISAKFGPSEIKARSLLRYTFRSSQGIEIIEQLAQEKAECICFVPVHWRRRISRGFDLSALLANELRNQLKIPIYYAIRCARQEDPSTLTQSKSDRVKRIQDRFRLNRNYPHHKKVILVDDIITTGITISTVSQLLMNQGCEVKAFTLARNPLNTQKR